VRRHCGKGGKNAANAAVMIQGQGLPSAKVGRTPPTRPPAPVYRRDTGAGATVMIQGRPARCVSALSGGTVDCPPLPSPVSVTATDHATGISPSPGSSPGSWRRSLHRGAAILGRLMPAGLPGVSVLSVVAKWEALSAAPVSRQGAGCRACHPSLFNSHGPCRGSVLGGGHSAKAQWQRWEERCQRRRHDTGAGATVLPLYHDGGVGSVLPTFATVPSHCAHHPPLTPAVDRPDGPLGLDARAKLDAAHELARDRLSRRPACHNRARASCARARA